MRVIQSVIVVIFAILICFLFPNSAFWQVMAAISVGLALEKIFSDK